MPAMPVPTQHEEYLRGDIILEVKQGAQVRAVRTAYARARAQSDDAREPGDDRPFVLLAMPDSRPRGLVVIDTDDIYKAAKAIVHQFEENE